MTTQLISQRVKVFTSKQHADTEKKMVQRLRDIGTAGDYVNLLRCFYGFFRPLEENCKHHLQESLPDFDKRRKAETILSDLEELGINSSPDFFSEQIPDNLSKARAFGFFYVMEGSTMGGPIIMKMVRKKCPEIPVAAFSYFSGYGDRNQEMWGRFVNTLNTQITEAESNELCEASAQCFFSLSEWIDHYYNTRLLTLK